MRTPIPENSYQAPIWQLGGHLQTVLPALLAKPPKVLYQRERWELADGDFIDVDWAHPKQAMAETNATKPIVALFHGLEGSSQSHYAKAVMHATINKGWTGVVIHFRGCSGVPNRLPRFYYAGESEEIQRMLESLASRVSNRPVYAAGFSLGGNALLKWMGECSMHASTFIFKAAAISVPFDLAASASALDRGLNRRIYTPMFVSSIKKKALTLSKKYPHILDVGLVKSAKTIHEIDNAVTAVLYGAKNAQDYYLRNSCKPWLSKIEVPTLIVNAKNDPFFPEKYLPTASEVSGTMRLEYTQHGGHVGFAMPPFPSHIRWLPDRLMRFFELGY